MTEEWKQLSIFPTYEISTHGRIKGRWGRVVRQTLNQRGHAKINLYLEDVQMTRQVGRLVLMEFEGPAQRVDFDTVIHLNGDKADCRLENLTWRPKHFATKYHQQFHHRMFETSHVPIRDIRSGDEYETAQEAAVERGLLLSDILIATHERTYVWPGFHEFERIE